MGVTNCLTVPSAVVAPAPVGISLRTNPFVCVESNINQTGYDIFHDNMILSIVALFLYTLYLQRL